jgi:hypothetical protein
VTDSNEVHPYKKYVPVDVTLLGITIDVKFVIEYNALAPIDVTVSGIVMEVVELSQKEFEPILVTV